MSYNLTKKSSPNYWQRGGTSITEIVIHHWGATGQSFSGVCNWLCNPSAKVSAHYVVMGGKVCQLLDESLAGWHAGNKAHNLKSIGIECRPEATEADYQTVAELVADIWHRRGKLPLIRHKDIVATSCPGVWDISKIKSMAEKIYSGGSTSSSSASSTGSKSVAEIAKEVIAGKWGNGDARKSSLTNAGYNYNDVQTAVNSILKGGSSVAPATSSTFKVQVTIKDLFIRSGAGTNYAHKGFIKPGVYTIVETKSANGHTWGKLKSGVGWIALTYAKRL